MLWCVKLQHWFIIYALKCSVLRSHFQFNVSSVFLPSWLSLLQVAVYRNSSIMFIKSTDERGDNEMLIIYSRYSNFSFGFNATSKKLSVQNQTDLNESKNPEDSNLLLKIYAWEVTRFVVTCYVNHLMHVIRCYIAIVDSHRQFLKNSLIKFWLFTRPDFLSEWNRESIKRFYLLILCCWNLLAFGVNNYEYNFRSISLSQTRGPS